MTHVESQREKQFVYDVDSLVSDRYVEQNFNVSIEIALA